MFLTLVPEQNKKFDLFADFLRQDVPRCVWSHSSVAKAIDRHGLLGWMEDPKEIGLRSAVISIEKLRTGELWKRNPFHNSLKLLRELETKRLDALPPKKDERLKLLRAALSWGTPPEIMVMSQSAFMGGGDDWAGVYDPSSKRIVILKSLVEAWQKREAMHRKGQDDDGFRILLYRNILSVVLHEMVHYFNDLLMPGTKINSAEHHLLDTFQSEAFAPLGWEKADYIAMKGVLEMAGVE